MLVSVKQIWAGTESPGNGQGESGCQGASRLGLRAGKDMALLSAPPLRLPQGPLRQLLQRLPARTLSQPAPSPAAPPHRGGPLCPGVGTALQVSLGMQQLAQFLLSSRRQMEPPDFLVTREIERKHHPLLTFTSLSLQCPFLKAGILAEAVGFSSPFQR